MVVVVLTSFARLEIVLLVIKMKRLLADIIILIAQLQLATSQ
jgi:hypothetical protein